MIITLLVAYVIGIVCIGYLKLPVPSIISKKLAALITGSLIVSLIVYAVTELLN